MVSSDFPLEEVDREAWLDFFRAAPADFVASARVAFGNEGSTGLIGLPALSWTEFNRAIGLASTASEADLDRAIAWLDTHAAPTWVIQLPPHLASGLLGGWLEARQLKARGNGWAKLFRDDAPIPALPPTPGIETRLLAEGDAQDFASVAQTGFGLPPETKPWFASLVGRPRWRVYAAYEQDRPIGAGAMFVEGRHAWLGIDTTLADSRRKGAQSVLIARRIADGIELGLRGFIAETAPPIGANENFISFRNFERAGFQLAYLRGNFGRG